MKKILVVVDMQNDFITGPLGTPEAVAIVDKVVEKIRGEEWDAIYITMDTHFSHRYLGSQEGKKLPIPHCIKHTDGWELNDKLWDAIDPIITDIEYEEICKPTFGSTKLAEVLKIYEYDEVELTLVGVCTDICVISNALLLKAHYPEMKIVVDASCCAGSTPFRHTEALDVMRSCQVEVINEVNFDQDACNQKYLSACAIDADCSEYCTMDCPYKKRK